MMSIGGTRLAPAFASLELSELAQESIVPLTRVPEPALLTPREEAAVYASMNHRGVNEQFVEDLAAGEVGSRIIDLGCGPGEIAILICQRWPAVEVMAVDLEAEMLDVARREIEMAGLLTQIQLEQADACQIDGFADAIADTVVSNSLIHHVVDPHAAIAAAVRLTRPGGRIFIRDLARPDSDAEVEQLVETYCGDENEKAQQLFRQSLHAAWTVEEMRETTRGLGIGAASIQMTSDRHWTIDWQRPTEAAGSDNAPTRVN